MAIFRQLTATMAKPGHLEYQRASRHAPPRQVGGTGLSRFQHRTAQVKCRCPRALIATKMSAIAIFRQLTIKSNALSIESESECRADLITFQAK